MADKEKKVTQLENKSAKPAKSEKKKGRLGNAWRGFKSEVKKIVWPSGKQVFKNTWVVLVIVLICAVVIAALDYAFAGGIGALTDIFRS